MSKIFYCLSYIKSAAESLWNNFKNFYRNIISCWSWHYLWIVWILLVIYLIYFFRGPLKIFEYINTMSIFLGSLSPRFYVALTGTSSLISGIILIVEWWYFRKYGTSFIEQVSTNHLNIGSDENESNSNQITEGKQKFKVWKNPLNLLRGSEYNRYQWVTGNEPLTFYDMNLSAQDHQTYFTSESDHLRICDHSKLDFI